MADHVVVVAHKSKGILTKQQRLLQSDGRRLTKQRIHKISVSPKMVIWGGFDRHYVLTDTSRSLDVVVGSGRHYRGTPDINIQWMVDIRRRIRSDIMVEVLFCSDGNTREQVFCRKCTKKVGSDGPVTFSKCAPMQPNAWFNCCNRSRGQTS